MLAAVVCSTTTTNGFLQWRINNGPVVYTIDSDVPVNEDKTINGSVFVYSDYETVSGATVVTSTASLNTLNVTSVQCSDGVKRLSCIIVPEGKLNKKLKLQFINIFIPFLYIQSVMLSSSCVTVLVRTVLLCLGVHQLVLGYAVNDFM